MLTQKQFFNWSTWRCLNQSRQKHAGFAYTGDPFKTEIKMKRQVEDPSFPDFEKQECLKWAKWSMLRDVKRRHKNSEYWQYRRNLMSVAYCRTLPTIVRDIAVEDRNDTPREAGITWINNRCAVTSRPRGLFHRYRISRIVWRDMADHGLISGAIRAKWGWSCFQINKPTRPKVVSIQFEARSQVLRLMELIHPQRNTRHQDNNKLANVRRVRRTSAIKLTHENFHRILLILLIRVAYSQSLSWYDGRKSILLHGRHKVSVVIILTCEMIDSPCWWPPIKGRSCMPTRRRYPYRMWSAKERRDCTDLESTPFSMIRNLIDCIQLDVTRS